MTLIRSEGRIWYNEGKSDDLALLQTAEVVSDPQEVTMRKLTPRKPIFQADSNTYVIPLTKGQSTIVDVCDVDLADVRWCAHISRNCNYARRGELQESGRKYEFRMHRVIMERILGRVLNRDEIVDHVDGNGLNNIRSNLRLADKRDNSLNSRKPKNNRTGFKGVSFEYGRWRARIKVDGKCIHLGCYSTPEAAHDEYSRAAQQYFGEFANDGAMRD